MWHPNVITNNLDPLNFGDYRAISLIVGGSGGGDPHPDTTSLISAPTIDFKLKRRVINNRLKACRQHDANKQFTRNTTIPDLYK